MASNEEFNENKIMSPVRISFSDTNIQQQIGIRRMGYLKKLKTMKKKFYVLRESSAEQPSVLEYYDNERRYRKRSTPKKPSVISGAFAINKKEDSKQNYVIAIFTSTSTHCVVANSEREQNEWLQDLLELQRTSPGQVQTLELIKPLTPTFDYVWNVKIMEKDLGAMKEITGAYRLCFSNRTVKLYKMNATSDADRIAFPLAQLRQVGHNDMYVYLEVGRHAITGSGKICMAAEGKQSAQHIHDIISAAMRKGGGADEMAQQQSSGHRVRSDTESNKPRQVPEPRRNTIGAKPKNEESSENASKSVSLGDINLPSAVITTNVQQTPEYIHPEFTRPDIGVNYVPIKDAYYPCDYSTNKPSGTSEQRSVNYSSLAKPGEQFSSAQCVSSVADSRPSLSPPTIPEEPVDYMTINMSTSGSQRTLHNEPVTNSPTESTYLEMSLPLKADSSKLSAPFTPNSSRNVLEDQGYMMMAPSSGVSSSGLSDSRRSTMSNSSYQSYVSGKDDHSSSHVVNSVTYAVMEPVNATNRSRDHASWNNSSSSIGSSSYGWDQFSSFQCSQKLAKVRAFMTPDDPNPQLRETRAYSTGCQPSKPPVSLFKTDVSTGNYSDAFRTRAFSLGNHAIPSSSSRNQRKLVHSPSSSTIGNGLRASSPLTNRDIRPASTSDTQLSPGPGTAMPSFTSVEPAGERLHEGSNKEDDMFEVTFRPKSG